MKGARIRDEDLEEVRRRVAIVEVASDYMVLKRSGRQFRALCPFHAEKTPSFYVDPAKNLYHCLGAETGVLTWGGIRPIAELAGGTHRLLTNGGRWVDAPVRSFGTQPLWAVELTRNRRKKALFATDGHRWLLRDRPGRTLRERNTAQLRQGDPLAYAFPNSQVVSTSRPSPFGVAQGFVFGDGTRTRYGSIAIFADAKDAELLPFFPMAHIWENGFRKIGGLPLFFKELPSLSEAPPYLYGWLAGYFAADGTVSPDGEVVLSSASSDNLEFVRMLANRLGIGTYGIKGRRGVGMGREETTLHNVTFISSSLGPEFFVLKKHRARFEALSERREKERKGWVVEAVSPTDRIEEVYCAVVPDTHSFVLEDNILTGNCHGCQEGGDTIRLVEKLENCSFVEAVERLARRAGVELRYEQMSAADRQAFARRARLVDAHRAAVEHYHDVLLRDPAAEEARTYLQSRGFDKQVAVGFSLGFAKPGLSKHLSRQGFSEEVLAEAGLAVRAPDGSLADRFRGRLMFPIFDVTGDPVAFGARRLGDGDGPKYINSAESPIYKKAHLLYALNWAKADVVKAGRALVVEGYTDVIACHQAGIRDAVATCGTALGLDHVRSLQRFTQQVVLSLDADEAGGAAADRAYDQMMGEAQRMGLALKVVLMREGDDPADAVRKDAEGFRALVDDAVPLLEFVLRREAARYQVGDPEVRARALAACVRLLAKTEHPTVRDEYARRLSDWIRVDPNVLFLELGKALQSGAPPKVIADAVLRRSSREVRLEREALKIAIHHPEKAKEHDDIGPECFSIPSHRAIWTTLATGADPELLDDEAARKAYTALAVQAPVWEVTDRLVAEVFGRLKGCVLSRHIDELKARLQRLNPIEEKQAYEMLFAELIDLEKRKRALVREDEDDR